MKSANIVIGEWLFVLRGPARGRPGLVAVVVENVEPKDRPMARALAMVAAAWLSATRRAA